MTGKELESMNLNGKEGPGIIGQGIGGHARPQIPLDNELFKLTPPPGNI